MLCYNVCMQAHDRPKTPGVVDFHVHAFPDHVAQSALDALYSAYRVTPVTDGTLSGLLSAMDRDGVSHSVVMPVATKPTQVRSINDWAASQTNPRLVVFGGIHPELEGAAEEVDRIASLGLPGIKIQANWQGVFVTDPRMYQIYEAAQGRLSITFHSGSERIPFDPLKATPSLLAKVHADFPRLTMIAAHMGGYRMWDEMEEHLLGKDVYMDTSACFPEELPGDRLLSLIRRHGVENVLFATDSPLAAPGKEIERLAEMGLTDSELEAILWGNAKRLLGDRVS